MDGFSDMLSWRFAGLATRSMKNITTFNERFDAQRGYCKTRNF